METMEAAWQESAPSTAQMDTIYSWELSGGHIGEVISGISRYAHHLQCDSPYRKHPKNLFTSLHNITS